MPQVVLAERGERGKRRRRVPDTHTHTQTASATATAVASSLLVVILEIVQCLAEAASYSHTQIHTRRAIKSCRGKITKKRRRIKQKADRRNTSKQAREQKPKGKKTNCFRIPILFCSVLFCSSLHILLLRFGAVLLCIRECVCVCVCVCSLFC